MNLLYNVYIGKMGCNMKKVLVIGSSVCDVIINIQRIPQQGEDENIISQSFQMGGCAFNVASMLQYFDIPFDLFSPIGKGIYGEFVKKHFINENIPIMIETNQDNGCCYCLVDESGERTFICEHKAEYIFEKEWFQYLQPKDYQYVYICGLEIEEQTGQYIIEFLEQNPHLQVVFAPSPRICKIHPEKMERIFALHPIIHLNQQEILQYTHHDSIENAAIDLYTHTHQIVIVTLGDKGCYYYDGNHHYVSGYQVQVVDTIGAGDSHIGTILAMLYQGKTLNECMIKANQIASIVVSQKGARL